MEDRQECRKCKYKCHPHIDYNSTLCKRNRTEEEKKEANKNE